MNTYLLTSLVAFSVAGAVVPATAMTDDEGTTAIERLVAQFEASVDQAVNEVRAIPLVPTQAYGHTSNGTVASISVLVRAVGDVDLDSMVLFSGPSSTAWRVVEVIRDADGSVPGGRMSDGDLVRLEIQQVIERGDEVSLRLDVPGHRSHQWQLEAPRNLAPDLVELQLRVLH